MKIKKMVRVFVSIVLFIAVISFHEGCNKSDITGTWRVKIKYNNSSKKKVIPENSIFRFDSENNFYINGKKATGKYKKKGKIIRAKIALKGSKYVVRGVFIGSNTIKGEIKKIITDTEIAAWVARKKK